MSRPKIEIQWEPLDWYLEVLGIIAVVFMVLYPFYFYGQLPAEIPNHFDGSGNVNGYGHKSGIWLVPAIALGTYVFLWLLNKIPHQFNYTVEITEENAHSQYQMATRLMRIINVTMVVFFAYITYTMVKAGLGGAERINNTAMFIFITLLLILPIGYLIINWKKHA